MEVNIRSIVKNKSIKMYRRIPSFVFWLFEKVVCQKKINELLVLYSDLKGVKFIVALLDHLNIKRVVKYTNINSTQKGDRAVIFASNHPLGGVDSFVLLEHVVSKYGDVRIVVNDILMNIEPLKELFIPVNKHGRQSGESVKQLNDVLMSDIPIIYFPAGLCSRKINGAITDLKWHKNFVKKAIEYKRDIVPIKVDSLNSIFFYNFAHFRSSLKIKVNIEMILLPSEIFKKENKEIKVIFGEKIEYNSFKECKDINEFTLVVRERCYSLQA